MEFELTDEEIQQAKRGHPHIHDADKAIAHEAQKELVKWLDSERGAWYSGGILIRKEIWQSLLKRFELEG